MRRCRPWLAPLLLCMAAAAHAQTPPPDPDGPDSASGAKLLEAWDGGVRALRLVVWTIYSEYLPLGRDARGRTVADDLSEWTMSRAVRAQLNQARAAAEQALRAGAGAPVDKLLETTRESLQTQTEHLNQIGLYWSRQGGLQRQRRLLERWGADAPALLAAGEPRLRELNRRLLADFASLAGLTTLAGDLDELTRAYNQERIRIAGSVSAQQAAAGRFTASRDRSLPCPQPPPAEGPGRADHHAVPRGDVAVESFYPRNAREDGISGAVVLRLTVSVQGCMTHGEVIRSSGSPALDDAALDVAEHMSYLPALKDGRPAEDTTPMRFTFELEGEPQAERPPAPPAEVTPATVEAFSAARDLMAKGDNEAAIAGLDLALAQSADDVPLLLMRATAQARSGHEAEALADLERALQHQPHNIFGLRLRAQLTQQAGRFSEAIAAWTGILELAPGDKYSMTMRLQAAAAAGDIAQALTYGAENVREFPADPQARSVYAALLRLQHRPEESLAQAAALDATEPAQVGALTAAAGIYAASGSQAEALQAADRAVAMSPDAGTYLMRARYRAHADRAGRLADIHAALELVPGSVPAALMLAEEQSRAGEQAAALDTLQQAVAAHADDVRVLVRRGIAFLKAGRRDAGEADIRTARSLAQTPQDLNALCWQLAIAGVELERARAACEAAVKGEPLSFAALDSLGLVLLKLGELPGALEAYDTALRTAPLNTDSLFGRALVRQRLGDRTGAVKDLAAARALEARIDEVFADYGLTARP